ncbi:Caskin-2 [Termitomyces sp. T112]|nr:Caskin-2 [Termitomyces sp. T112]
MGAMLPSTLITIPSMSKTEAQLTDDINKAIGNGDLERTTILVDEWSSLSSTPLNIGFLDLASQTGSGPIVSLLLSRGLNSRVYTDALISACEPDYNVDVLQAFLDSGWDINTGLGYMGDLLALCLNSPSMIKWVLAHGADPNLNYNNGSHSALETAVINESPESVEVLIDIGGAQISNTNALKFAARFGRTEMIELLLARGVEINEIPRPKYANNLMDYDTGMGTALHQAAIAGQLDAVQLLLEKGADPRLKNIVGKTALELARERNHATVVDVLEGW